MKFLKNHLIPAIFFTVWTIAFGIWFIIRGANLIGPIFTGIAAVLYWLFFLNDQIEKKKLKKQNND